MNTSTRTPKCRAKGGAANCKDPNCPERRAFVNEITNTSLTTSVAAGKLSSEGGQGNPTRREESKTMTTTTTSNWSTGKRVKFDDDGDIAMGTISEVSTSDGQEIIQIAWADGTVDTGWWKTSDQQLQLV